MTSILANRAAMASSQSGTGTTIALGATLGAVVLNACSFQSIANAGITNGQAVSYLILDANGNWEAGHAVYSSSGPSLTSRTPLWGSSGQNTAINLSGNEQIMLTALAEDLVTAVGGLTNSIGLGAFLTTSGQNIVGRPWQIFVISSTNSSWNLSSEFGYVPSELILEAWGGGGSGSGASSGGTNRGTGGGGAQYFLHHYAGTMDTTLNITIGAGGVAVGVGSAGNAGGATTIVGTNLGTLTANGGAGGGAAPSSGGSGGTGGTNATFSLAGGDGTSQQGTGSNADFGIGGDSPRGGRGGRVNVAIAGKVPGGGGSGANNSGSSGAGANGQVIIWGR